MDDQALNVPDFTVLLQATPDSLKIICIIKITKAIIVSDLAENCHIETLTEHSSRGDLRIHRLLVICPGDRFGVCTQWQNFHISCFVSRAFHLLCQKLLFDLDWASTTEIEQIWKIVEDRFKIRLLSVIDAVNTCRDNRLVCERYHRVDRTKECLECLFHMMMERYYKKRLEFELLGSQYWFKHDRPMKGYFKPFELLHKAVQEWEYSEYEKERQELDKEMEQINQERRQMNIQFETSKKRKLSE